MTIHMIVPALAMGLVLAACAGTPKQTPSPASAPVGTPMTSLPAQNLAAGECGLFLWSLQSPHNLIFFRKAGASTADSVLTGMETPLNVQSEGGKVFGQFLTDATYEARGGQRVSVSLVPGDMIQDGQRTKSAEIRVQSPEGWETIIPASGLTACIPEEGDGN
ncbi:MAG: hypothetical protein R3B98_07000 [Hyphomonas sp.]